MHSLPDRQKKNPIEEVLKMVLRGWSKKEQLFHPTIQDCIPN